MRIPYIDNFNRSTEIDKLNYNFRPIGERNSYEFFEDKKENILVNFFDVIIWFISSLFTIVKAIYLILFLLFRIGFKRTFKLLERAKKTVNKNKI